MTSRRGSVRSNELSGSATKSNRPKPATTVGRPKPATGARLGEGEPPVAGRRDHGVPGGSLGLPGTGPRLVGVTRLRGASPLPAATATPGGPADARITAGAAHRALSGLSVRRHAVRGAGGPRGGRGMKATAAGLKPASVERTALALKSTRQAIDDKPAGYKTTGRRWGGGSLRHEATASGRVTQRASSDPACIAPPDDIGSPPGEAPTGWRASLCTSGRTCPMCGGTASTPS